MKIFLTGATGVLGRRLVSQLVASGDSVTGLARNDRAIELVRTSGGIPFLGDHFDADSIARGAEGSEVVIHGATAIPSKIRYSAADWSLNDRLRREGTRALTEAAGKIGAKIYIQQSIVWVARPADETYFDESTEPHPDPVYTSSLDAEQIAQEAGKRYGFQVAILRCGLFYSSDSVHTKMMGEGLLKRRSPIIGPGDAIWAVLHADDAASAFFAAAKAFQAGLWHVVDDQPVKVEEFIMEFARQLGAPAPFHVPVWVAKLMVGSATVRHFTVSTRTSNEKFRKDFGWMPRYPSYKEGLQQVAKEWK
jgi:nucleoside-diphosphate-sugar epimerase